jgi:hypothetical protein
MSEYAFTLQIGTSEQPQVPEHLTSCQCSFPSFILAISHVLIKFDERVIGFCVIKFDERVIGFCALLRHSELDRPLPLAGWPVQGARELPVKLKPLRPGNLLDVFVGVGVGVAAVYVGVTVPIGSVER